VTLLDRYIFKSVLVACFAAVCLFAFVLMAGNIIRDLIGPLLSGQLGFLMFGRLVLLLVPFVISYALPLGMLTAVLLALGRFSSDSEITAMRAAGLSLPRIALPALFLAAGLVAVGLKVNFQFMPWARVTYHQDFAASIRTNPLSFIIPKTFIRDFPGNVIYVGSKEGPVVRDIWVWQLDAQSRAIRFIRAESGRVDFDEATNSFIVPLHHATIEDYDRKAPDNFTEALHVNTVGQVDPIHLSLTRYSGAGMVHQKLDWMTYGELEAEKARIEAQPVPIGGEGQRQRDIMKVALTIQEKINLSLAIFSFALVGVPLGIKVSRRETSANLGVAVTMALSYYFLTVMVGWLDRHPEYRPDLLLWVPNFIFLGVGIWLLRRLDRA
jgi:lipopolysaccharide export system permease protein